MEKTGIPRAQQQQQQQPGVRDVVVARKQGRKIFVRGAIEDEDGFFFMYPGWAREADS